MAAPILSDNDMAESLGISERLLQLLRLRGLSTKEEMQHFLSPNLRFLAPLDLWPGLMDAANVLVAGIKQGKKIAVWGDYDVDGITSTCLVLDVLEAHDISAIAHLPDRCTEGYGLNKSSIDALIAKGVEILLTVDCGISDVEVVAYAKERGLCVVISDHHLPPQILPNADAICNPQLAACPCNFLAGVGVAFFLMCAVNAALTKHTQKNFDMREVLDLVALGTLADVVTLQGQNRILVKNGLLKIATTARPGMAALKSICKFHIAAPLTGGQVVFTLAPRINAAGRIGQAHDALALLRAPDFDTALPIAKRLDAMNSERRKEEERIHEEARLQAKEYAHHVGLVLYSPHWHPGIIGIVASRIVEEFHRPTLILCKSTGFLKGSGRSIKQFHLHEGLSNISDILLGYGGHKLAAGLSLEEKNIDILRARFNDVVRESLGETLPLPSLTLDTSLDFSLASDALFLREIEMMQPFGMGNAEPVFASPKLLIKNIRTFGYNKEHTILEVLDESTGITLQAKAWRSSALFPKTLVGQYIYLAYSPAISTFNGVASVELRIKDWKKEDDA